MLTVMIGACIYYVLILQFTVCLSAPAISMSRLYLLVPIIHVMYLIFKLFLYFI